MQADAVLLVSQDVVTLVVGAMVAQDHAERIALADVDQDALVDAVETVQELVEAHVQDV